MVSVLLSRYEVCNEDRKWIHLSSGTFEVGINTKEEKRVDMLKLH